MKLYCFDSSSDCLLYSLTFVKWYKTIEFVKLLKNFHAHIFVCWKLFEVLACFFANRKMHSSVIYLTFNGSVFRKKCEAS